MTPQLWDEKNRGNVPMMWAISPALEVRAPMAMEYLRSTASDMDYFVAADNGAGYLNPSMLAAPRPISNLPSGLDAWAEHCKPMYNRWDMTVTGFIIDGFCAGMNEDCMACYKKFSPNGIVPQKVSKYAKLYDGMPILKSGPDINDGSSSAAAASLVSLLNSHPIFPFYWSPAILKSVSRCQEQGTGGLSGDGMGRCTYFLHTSEDVSGGGKLRPCNLIRYPAFRSIPQAGI